MPSDGSSFGSSSLTPNVTLHCSASPILPRLLEFEMAREMVIAMLSLHV